MSSPSASCRTHASSAAPSLQAGAADPPPCCSAAAPCSGAGTKRNRHHRNHHHHNHHKRRYRPSSSRLQQPPPARGPPPARHKHSVHWFRKGLRLHDNPSLLDGIQGAATLRCIFFLDPWFAGTANVGINKWRFLLQCLEDLDRNLRKFDSRLFVIRGQPADALPKLFKEWGTTNLTFEEDPEPFGRVRDQNIMAMCSEINISVVSVVSHTLYKLEKIIEKNGGNPPLTYHQFQTVIASLEAPPDAFESLVLGHWNGCHTPVADDHDDKYGVPTLEELGFETRGLKPAVWRGGESEALTRLEHHLERKAYVASFGRPKMTPQSLLPSQTGLSPYLRFGCLSTRLFYHKLASLYKKIRKATPPLSLHGQLLWREFFYCTATHNPNFDKMKGNPICVQIPWDRNLEALAKWANGQTGFPWIDAIMTQLREEGWIHHIARHAVACFLTRGNLWISWEEGMKVFEELLLDADWSVNAGMWMWLSCSSFFQQFFHCYCPVRFGRKADPEGDYIRRYLPVLKNFPTQNIHDPWNAPESVQKAAKCVIGKDYPKPMVNHAVASSINIERMKQVYTQLSNYRGAGTGAGSSLLKEQLRLLATVPSSISSLVSQSKASLLQDSISGDIVQKHHKHQDGPSQEDDQPKRSHGAQQASYYHHHQQQQQQQHQQHQQQQQQQLQPRVRSGQKPHQQQVTDQQQQQQHQHQQHLNDFDSHYQSLNQQHSQQRQQLPQNQIQSLSPIQISKNDIDSQLMGPPKSPYRKTHSQQPYTHNFQITQQQVEGREDYQVYPVQSLPRQQQLGPLHACSEPMHAQTYTNEQPHNLPPPVQTDQLDIDQNYSTQQNQQDQLQQWWPKANEWPL